MWVDRLVGNRIRAQLDALRVSVQAIAERPCIDLSILIACDSGKKRIKRRDLIKIACALDMSPEALLEGSDPTTGCGFPRVSFERDTVRISRLC